MIDTNPSLRNLTDVNYGKPQQYQHQPLQEVGKPHVESFNYMVREGLSLAVKSIDPVELQFPNGQRVAITVQDAVIGLPAVSSANSYATTIKVYPAECRVRGTSYKGPVNIQVAWTVDGREAQPIDKHIGDVPIMVKSSACNLAPLYPPELVKRGEEAGEWGGYFIINGNERLIRMLIMPRRNYPLALCRGSWKNRGDHYTEFGLQMRCVARDQTAASIVLHYLNTGSANLSFTYKKEQFFVPVILILKALVDVPDQYIYQELIKGREKNSFYKGCVANMLRQTQAEGFSTRRDILAYIGTTFRIKLHLPEWKTDAEVGEYLLRHCICIHLDKSMDKFNILVYMTRKLFAFAKGECAAESADNPMFQEVMLGGHLVQLVIKEKIENYLLSLKYTLERNAKKKGPEFTLDKVSMTEALKKCPDVSRALEFFFATGNLVSKTGLGLMQASGLTVVADKLNFFRYISHFRCIHRGAFFAEMRTTAVRKLLPEAWGFLCPVHTPDGSPCGLMNHMSALCQIVNSVSDTRPLYKLLYDMGVTPYTDPLVHPPTEYYPVMLDGHMLGWLHENSARDVEQQLRCMKVKGIGQVPSRLEICLVERTPVPSQFPGLYLFCTLTRMMRPVTNLAYHTTELIGSFEQVYLNICVVAEEAVPGETTHQEVTESSMLSMIASLTPFSDFNQSPRNMYQCQMGKQTMGTPCHALSHRSDNKIYRIQSPQAPLVRPAVYDRYNMDEYPLGTNAVVAVISYTGYDMEDAMIVNKSSLERGFGHASVYKAENIDVRLSERGAKTLIFGNVENGCVKCERLDADGLPPVGTYLQEGDPYYSTLNLNTGEVKVTYYRSMEPAHVDRVSALGDDLGKGPYTKAGIILRINRNPIIGDKFSSRHGQKGIMSKKWPVEDLPFSESGMQPDILFNPHGFPSRMTIGMMIESMAGKASSMHGTPYDATPFTFSEDDSAIDYFGKLLKESGYSYYGTERLYSGIDGREFEADIFMGVVYYQRLRHMVSDKFQVRTTGAVDILTKQPIKGRKKGGGIRFGEMERDALLAHGTSFLLQDRLFNCSDRSVAWVCASCGSLLSPLLEAPVSEQHAMTYNRTRRHVCKACQGNIVTVSVPYVFRYLCAEMAAMNIKIELDVQQR